MISADSVLFKPMRLGHPQSTEHFSLKNEELNIDFSQEDAKISEVKVGGQKKHLPISPV